AAAWRAAHVELPALAERVRGDGVPGRAVARLRPARPVAGLPGVRLPGPPFRRGDPERATAGHGGPRRGARGLTPARCRARRASSAGVAPAPSGAPRGGRCTREGPGSHLASGPLGDPDSVGPGRRAPHSGATGL